jgi:hypothetical protein
MGGNYPIKEVEKLLDLSSKEMSRLTEYISFGILIANFSQHKCIHPFLLFVSCFLSSLVLILHFRHYKEIYERSYSARENQNKKVEKDISVDYSVPRRLFWWKTWLLYISIVTFGVVAINIFYPPFCQKMFTCIFS